MRSGGGKQVIATATRNPKAPGGTAAAPRATIQPPPAVRLNEVMTHPAVAGSTGGDLLPDRLDTWIELYNAGPRAVDLLGWRLVSVGQGITQTYTITTTVTLLRGEHLVMYESQTGLDLSPAGGALQLWTRQGRLGDAVRLPALPPGASYSRDTLGQWHADWPPSPGATNVRPAAVPRKN